MAQAKVRYLLLWGSDFSQKLTDGKGSDKPGTVTLDSAAATLAEQKWGLVPQVCFVFQSKLKIFDPLAWV